MKKTVTIDRVLFDSEWNTKDGKTKYNFKVIYEDNGKKTEAIYYSDYKDQNKFKEGATVDIDESVQSTHNGGTMVKVKPWYEPKSKGGKSYTPNNASFALAYSKDLVVANRIEFDQLLPAADKMYDWLMSKN